AERRPRRERACRRARRRRHRAPAAGAGRRRTRRRGAALMNRIWAALDQLEPKQKLLVAIGAPLLILGAYFMLFLGPRLTRTAELRTHIENMEKDRESKLADASAVGDRQKEVEDLERQLQL